MGYGTLNGASAAVVSALSKYGLLEGQGDKLRVSEMGQDIVLHRKGYQEYGEALKAAALMPAFFRELRDQYPEGLPSEHALRATLIKRGFNPKAIDSAVRAFRDTAAFVDAEAGGRLAESVAEPPPIVGSQTASVEQQTESTTPRTSEDIPGQRAIALPLAVGEWATLHAAFPLTETAWNQMMTVLTAMKPALVAPLEQPDLLPAPLLRQWGEGPPAGGPSIFWGGGLKTSAYIDGFNLYYGCYKNVPGYRAFKWLDLRGLCEALLPNAQIHRVHYFTAMVAATPANPAAPIRQETFIRALRTTPQLYVHLGKLQPVIRKGTPLDVQPGGSTLPARFSTWEEKGSDVNLATRLLTDAMDEDFEQALVISNDSDLMEPIRVVKQKFNLPIVVVSPYPTLTLKLRRASSSWAVLDKSLLAACQLPQALVDKMGRAITKPAVW